MSGSTVATEVQCRQSAVLVEIFIVAATNDAVEHDDPFASLRLF
jgi:hypothetical protein